MGEIIDQLKRSSLDRQKLIEALEFAKEQGLSEITVDGVTMKVGAPNKINIVPDLKSEEIVKPQSWLDDYTEEELLYYATPYFDELQAKKEAHKKQLEESKTNE